MRLLITCVSESDPGWVNRVENLALSKEMVGGSLAEARMVANFVGGISADDATRLEDLEVEVRSVDAVEVGGRHANKLRMLDLADEPFDVMLALDCDVIFGGDPSPFLAMDAIGLKPADAAGLSRRDWRALYGVAGLGEPQPVLRTTLGGKAIPPYFNSGVIAVPRALCGALREEWTRSHSWLSDSLQRDPHLLPPNLHWFADQISLGLAIDAARLPYRTLPLALNLPTHVLLPERGSGDPEPRILHYHRDIDEAGFLTRPRDPRTALAIDAFNRYRAGRRGQRYPGLRARPRRDRARLSARRLRAIGARRHHARCRVRDLTAALGFGQELPTLPVTTHVGR